MNTEAMMIDIPTMKRAKNWLESRIKEVKAGYPGYEPKNHYLTIYNLSLFVVNWFNKFKGFHYPLLNEGELDHNNIGSQMNLSNYKASCAILKEHYLVINDRYKKLSEDQKKGETQNTWFVAIDLYFYITQFEEHYFNERTSNVVRSLRSVKFATDVFETYSDDYLEKKHIGQRVVTIKETDQSRLIYSVTLNSPTELHPINKSREIVSSKQMILEGCYSDRLTFWGVGFDSKNNPYSNYCMQVYLDDKDAIKQIDIILTDKNIKVIYYQLK